MPSLGSILSIASSALRTQQQAMNATAHNIANAGTEGYARQVPVIAELPAVKMPNGVFGTGAGVVDIAQIRDHYADGTYRRELGYSSRDGMRSGLLGRIEGIFAEPTEGGLGAKMDTFFLAFSELATNPTDGAARNMVRESGRQLAEHFNGMAAELDSVRQTTEARLMAAVERVNELGRDIATLNERIVAAESGGTTAGDLRNERGRRLDELATLIPITVTQREFGAVGVLSAGVSLVDGAESYPLEIRNNGGALGVAVTTQTGTLTELGGSVGGMLQVLNTDIPGYRSRLDALTEALVAEVNALHQTGRNPDGNTGVDFFDPAGINATSIALSADVLASTGAIAAGTEDTNGSYQSGANDVAIALAGLRNTADPALGAEYGEYLAELVFDVGHDVRSSTSAAEAHTTLANQADIQRQAVSGVSIDEEMIRMIQFQAAYQAAARVVTTADEMIQTLLNM